MFAEIKWKLKLSLQMTYLLRSIYQKEKVKFLQETETSKNNFSVDSQNNNKKTYIIQEEMGAGVGGTDENSTIKNSLIRITWAHTRREIYLNLDKKNTHTKSHLRSDENLRTGVCWDDGTGGFHNSNRTETERTKHSTIEK